MLLGTVYILFVNNMDSGIYLLKFGPSNKGKYYIGKSNNIERRWKEHINKFNKGTAPKELQNAYNTYGMPEFTILLECHEDHIDLMESIYIASSWDKGLVNTAQPTKVSEVDEATLLENTSLLSKSTAEHLRLLKKREEHIKIQKKILEQEKIRYNKLLDTNTSIKNLMSANSFLEDLSSLHEEIIEYKNQEIKQLRNRTLWQRIVNK